MSNPTLRQQLFLTLIPVAGVFLVCCAIRLVFFMVNHHDVPPGNGWEQWYWILLYGFRSDAMLSLITAAPFFILRSLFYKWTAPTGRQLVAVLYAMVIVGLAAVSFIDAVYFNGNHRRLTQNDLLFFRENAGLLIPYMKIFWWLPFLLVTAGLLSFTAARQWMQQPLVSRTTGKLKIVFFLCYMSLLFISIYDVKTKHFFTPSSGYFVMKRENVPFSTNTISELLASEKYDRGDSAQWTFMDQKEAFSIHPVIKQVKGGPPNKKNIVLFIIESGSREDFEENDRRKRTMPFLDSLMKRSLVFDNFFANALSSPPGFDAVVGGLPEGYAADFYRTGYGYNKTQWFTELLKKAGYSTHFFYGVKDFSYSFLKTSKIYQLDHDFGYRNYIPAGNDFDGYYGIYDHIFFPAIANELKKVPQPFLSVLYNVSTHAPYNLIPAAILDTLPVFARSNGRSLRYFDNVMKDFFSSILNQAWFSNTIFLFVSDHFSRAPDATAQSAVDRFKIPMFIYAPDASFAGHSPAVAQQIDIPLTILEMTQVRGPFFSFGRSVFDTTGKKIAFNISGDLMQAIDDHYVLQYNISTKKVQGYYNYIQDPALAVNLYVARQYEAKDLLKELLAFWEVYFFTLRDNKMHPDKF